MRNLSKRSEALERIALAMRQERRQIVERAFLDLSLKEFFLCLDACLGDHVGRVPTEEQSAALQSLSSAIAQERHGALPQLAAREWILDFWDIVNALDLIFDYMGVPKAPPRFAKLPGIRLAGYSPEGADGKEVSDGTTGPAIPTGQ